ncbi:MAG: hypothetical protein AAF705_04850, partial [Bacteroidota bacterium]
MNESWKKEKQENFEAWIKTIEDRLQDWYARLSQDYIERFDYSIGSLDEIEKYLIEKYELSDLKNPENKIEIDAIASYVIKVF